MGRELARDGSLLTQDPIGLAGGVNLYAYAGNDPVSSSDPFGLCDPPGTCTQSEVPYRSRFTRLREALGRVLEKLGADEPVRPKRDSKFGNPNKTRGTSRRGYRLDPGHDDDERGGRPGSGGDGEHINFWDYTRGKKGSGREVRGHEPVQYSEDCVGTDDQCSPRLIMLPGFVLVPAPAVVVPQLPLLSPATPPVAPLAP